MLDRPQVIMAGQNLYPTVPERAPVAVLKEHLDSVDFLRINEDIGSPQLVSVAHDCTVKFWDLTTHHLLKSVAAHTEAIYCCDCSGPLLCTCSPDKSVLLWDFRTQAQVGSAQAHTAKVYFVRFTGTEEVVTCGRDGKLLLWDTRNLRSPKGDYSVHPDHIYRSVDVSADRSLLAAVTQNSQIEVFDFHSRRLLDEVTLAWDLSVFPEDADFLTPPSTIYCVRFLNQTKELLTAHQDMAVRKLGVAPSLHEEATLRNHYDYIRHVEVAADDSLFFSTCQDGSVRRWEGFQAVRSYTGASQIMSCAALTRDKRVLATSCWDQCVYLYQA